MKRLTWIIIMVCVLSLAMPQFAQKRGFEKLKYPELNQFTLPRIHKAETDNGIRLRVVQTDKLPLVDVRIMLEGGSVYDPADKIGLAAITANLLRIGGTEKWTGDELDLHLDQLGINLDVQASDDYFTITVSCLRKDLGTALEALAQVVRHPRFAKEKMEEIKTRMASAISRRNDEPNGIAAREFARVVYGKNSPFAAVMEYAHLNGIAIPDLKACHKKFFAPGNMLAGVSGPVNLDEVKALFETHFGDWKQEAVVPAYPKVVPAKAKARVFMAEKSNLNQSTIYIGHLGNLRDLKAEPAQKVFNAIFSQGMNSRLFMRVRTQMGLTYGVGGGISTAERHPGMTSFYTFTKSKSSIKAIQAILEEVNKIRTEPVTPEELEDARNYFINSFVFQFSGPEKILYSELKREFYDLPAGYSQRMLEGIKAVTAADVLETAKNFMNPDDFRILIVGKESDLDGKLSELGSVAKVDLKIPPPPVEEKIPPATPETLKKGGDLVKKSFSTVYGGYAKLKTLHTIAAMKMTVPQGTFDMGLDSTASYPDKSHTVITIMGMKIETVINGDKGIMTQMGQTKPMSAEQIRDNRFGSMYDMTHNPDAYNFQYLKEMKGENGVFDVIYVTPAKGGDQWVKLYFNRKTGRVEMEEKLSKMPGNAGIAREVNSDFRMVSGIPFAFKSVISVKGKTVSDVTIKEIVVNGPVEESLFKIEE